MSVGRQREDTGLVRVIRIFGSHFFYALPTITSKNETVRAL